MFQNKFSVLFWILIIAWVIVTIAISFFTYVIYLEFQDLRVKNMFPFFIRLLEPLSLTDAIAGLITIGILFLYELKYRELRFVFNLFVLIICLLDQCLAGIFFYSNTASGAGFRQGIVISLSMVFNIVIAYIVNRRAQAVNTSHLKTAGPIRED